MEYRQAEGLIVDQVAPGRTFPPANTFGEASCDYVVVIIIIFRIRKIGIVPTSGECALRVFFPQRIAPRRHRLRETCRAYQGKQKKFSPNSRLKVKSTKHGDSASSLEDHMLDDDYISIPSIGVCRL